MSGLRAAHKRILPFASYLTLLAAGSLLERAGMEESILWLYPVKILVVLGLMALFWTDYDELQKRRTRSSSTAVAILVGCAVYFVWVRMDWPWAMQSDGLDGGYNPFRSDGEYAVLLAGIRLFGAAAVVPLMEELFWRSFLIRYLISSKFQSVPLGTFTPLSFAATVVLFGFEHDLWLAGMVAGASYNAVWYYSRNLWPCILAHATTNLALGIHVLVTQEWKWW